MSWDTTQKHRRSLPSRTTNSMLYANSLTSAPPSLHDNLSLDAEIDKRIGKAGSTLACLTARVWRSPKLYVKTKMAVYNACVISTLLYGSEIGTTYAGQERRLNTFHLRSTSRILGISWQDKVTNADVLAVSCWSSQYVHSS